MSNHTDSKRNSLMFKTLVSLKPNCFRPLMKVILKVKVRSTLFQIFRNIFMATKLFVFANPLKGKKREVQ